SAVSFLHPSPQSPQDRPPPPRLHPLEKVFLLPLRCRDSEDPLAPLRPTRLPSGQALRWWGTALPRAPQDPGPSTGKANCFSRVRSAPPPRRMLPHLILDEGQAVARREGIRLCRDEQTASFRRYAQEWEIFFMSVTSGENTFTASVDTPPPPSIAAAGGHPGDEEGIFFLILIIAFCFYACLLLGIQDSQPNRILLATIHQMLYPITVEVLQQVFSPHGFVEKIVTFQKSAGQLLLLFASRFQALIQYQSRHSAVQARSSLQGRNIYDGCCQLDIQFSKYPILFILALIFNFLFIWLPYCLSELQVNYNNERSRDFTNPSLPSEQKGRSSQSGYGDAAGLYTLQPPGARGVAFPQVSIAQSMGLSLVQMGNAAAVAAAFGGGLPPGITGNNDRCTILASNLNSDAVDEDRLFNLFSLYGNIVRIKLLRNKPDHALIQMGDGFQAELAVHFLKGAMLFGKRLEVNFSKHPNITAAQDAHEYSGSSLNRFNRNAVKNYRYCCAPTKMIHLSSLPPDILEDEIVTHLEEHGTIINTKLFEANGKKQALVLFENEEQATEALVCKHATSIDGSTVRISFSQLQSI
ncbi:hypothetical protein Taro_022398, partial [Colocasia esculenta]|nr:hypothetical protein [Colocasia esculenta]